MDAYAITRHTRTIALAAALLTAAATTVAEAAPPAPLTGGSVIAFSAVGHGVTAVPHLWLMEVDTGKRQQITSGRYGEEQPSWAPGGERLVFARTRNVRVPGLPARQLAPLITTLTLSTRTTHRLASAEGYDEAPAWSPSGGRIAFARTTLTGGTQQTFPEIWTMDTRGRRLHRLTRNRVSDEAPAWSPDGRRIAFARQRGKTGLDVWMMRSNGSGAHRIVRNATQPSWSPDGKLIAYARPKRAPNGQCCARDLYVVSASGSGTRRLVVRDGTQPVWSPDGARIVYTSLTASRFQLAVVNADGSGGRKLTHFAGGAYAADWRP